MQASEATVRLDSSAAWKSATALVAGNREVLAAIAGVFFLLPGLVAAILVPTPEVRAGMSEQQMIEAMQAYYAGSLPWLLALSLVPMTGMLTMLVSVLDRARPTVAQAIRRGIATLPAYFAAQVLIALAILPAALLVMALLMLVLPERLAASITFAAMLYPLMRTLLVGPALAEGTVRGPVAAIRASLRQTRANAGRILAFLGLAGFLFLVVYGLTMMIVGVVLVLVSDGEVQRFLDEGLSGLLLAVGYTYFVAMLAAVHEQLAPPSAEAPVSAPE